MYFVSNVCVLFSGGDGREFCAQQVFVQGVCVSCHCVLQSTVVQSRVCQHSRGDLQMEHVSFFFLFKSKSKGLLVFLNKELWR